MTWTDGLLVGAALLAVVLASWLVDHADRHGWYDS